MAESSAEARDITALTDIEGASSHRVRESSEDVAVIWSAPRFTRTQAPMELKRGDGAETKSAAAPARLSETEIQRMADRVYGIIESRVALERRRMGY
jgi:hypothetical protein